MRKAVTTLTVTTVLALLWVEGHAATTWETSEFEVTFPDHCIDSFPERVLQEMTITDLNYKLATPKEREALNLGFERPGELHAYFNKIEAYLSEIADKYQKLGFPEPKLKKITTGSGKRFEVQYRDLSRGMPGDCKSPKTTRAYVTNPLSCDSRQQLFVINAAAWSPNGRRKRDAEIKGNPGLYDSDAHRYDDNGLFTTLAHELFHAVQSSYDRTYKSIQPCQMVTLDGVKQVQDFGVKDEGIIVEGMAQAVAVELANARVPIGQSLDRRVLGGFPFPYGIFDPPKGSAYYLASFWRYLADQSGGLSYLHDLLRKKVGKVNPDDLVRAQWLDEFLRGSKEFNETLYTLFPIAVTEIYSYGQSRYPKKRVQENWLNWLTKKGAGCLRADTSNQIAKFTLDLEPYSAACFEIRWYGFPNEVELHFEAIVQSDPNVRGDGEKSERLADQLHLGLAIRNIDGQIEDCWDWTNAGQGLGEETTCLYERVRLSTGPTPGTHARWWIPDEETKQDFRKRGKYVLVLANIAPANRSVGSKLRRTEAIKNLTFRVGFGGTLDENGQPIPPPRGRSMLGTSGLGSLEPVGQQRRTRMTAAIPPMSGTASPVFAASSMVSAMNPAILLASSTSSIAQAAGSLTSLGLPNLQSFIIGETGKRQYLVTPVAGLADYELGDTGTLQGEVVLYDPNALETSLTLTGADISDPEDIRKAYSGMITEGPGSRWCQSGPGAVDPSGSKPTGGRIGTIRKSSEDELVIDIDVDLCRMIYEWGKEQPEFKVVEKAQFTMTLPFGWRYFNDTMPRAVDSPGLAWYEERFQQTLASAARNAGMGSAVSADPFGQMPQFNLTEQADSCPCDCEEMQNLDPAVRNECVTLSCITQLAHCRVSDKIKETVIFSYEGTISIRALMALRKSHDDHGILNQNLNERENTITVLYKPSMIDQKEVEQFLRDLGVDINRTDKQ